MLAERELQSQTQFININTKYKHSSFSGDQTNGKQLRDLHTFPGDKPFPCWPVRSFFIRGDDLLLGESDQLHLYALNDVMGTSSTWDVQIILPPSPKAAGNARSWLRLIS